MNYAQGSAHRSFGVNELWPPGAAGLLHLNFTRERVNQNAPDVDAVVSRGSASAPQWCGQGDDGWRAAPVRSCLSVGGIGWGCGTVQESARGQANTIGGTRRFHSAARRRQTRASSVVFLPEEEERISTMQRQDEPDRALNNAAIPRPRSIKKGVCDAMHFRSFNRTVA